ncbi:uncharacterized protein LOC103824744 isoform X1 [Serinus canaria]|uniref:uncharacterized protein LOC103824744 isoform X1 n=1 Tax=Serinus canaria TaxID=9135 RepID=UPI0021CCFB69|nr:uncharacterized protein LOC103824744 isoform X1 [Serinus canaria]
MGAMEAPIAGKAGGEGTEQELLERQGMQRHLLLERQERRNRYSWKGWRWKEQILLGNGRYGSTQCWKGRRGGNRTGIPGKAGDMGAPISLGGRGEEGIEQELLERLEVREQELLERQEMEGANIAGKAGGMETPIAARAGGEGTEQVLLERQEVWKHLLLEKQEMSKHCCWKGRKGGNRYCWEQEMGEQNRYCWNRRWGNRTGIAGTGDGGTEQVLLGTEQVLLEQEMGEQNRYCWEQNRYCWNRRWGNRTGIAEQNRYCWNRRWGNRTGIAEQNKYCCKQKRYCCEQEMWKHLLLAGLHTWYSLLSSESNFSYSSAKRSGFGAKQGRAD